VNDVVSAILEWVQSVDPVLRTIIAGVAIMLETSVLVGLIVPGDTIVIVAASATTGLPERLVLTVVIIIGALIGESVGYALGHWLGPKIRQSWVGRKLGEKNWTRAERYLNRRGGPAVLLSRFLPVLHSLVPLTAGMSGFGYRRFLAWTLPACTVWSALYVTITAVATETYKGLSDRIHGAGYVFVAIIALFLVIVFVAKKVIERNERRHLQDDPPAPTDQD
jgi:membrane protein DedA with SNARE-associated domain